MQCCRQLFANLFSPCSELIIFALMLFLMPSVKYWLCTWCYILFCSLLNILQFHCFFLNLWSWSCGYLLSICDESHTADSTAHKKDYKLYISSGVISSSRKSYAIQGRKLPNPQKSISLCCLLFLRDMFVKVLCSFHIGRSFLALVY